MSRLNNTIKTRGFTTTILITKNDNPNYLKEVVIDTANLHLLKKVYVTARGYAWTNKCNLAHLIKGHRSNMDTVIDHINGNKLDNRETNLRVLDQCDNANNRNTSANNTGVVGIARRKSGNYDYFRVTVTDRNYPVTSSYTKSACRKYTKQFNINKLGKGEAFKRAKQWLEDKRKEFGYIDY